MRQLSRSSLSSFSSGPEGVLSGEVCSKETAICSQLSYISPPPAEETHMHSHTPPTPPIHTCCSWYSWLIHSLVNGTGKLLNASKLSEDGVHILFIILGVYAFGFLFMLPQLLLNYKVRLNFSIISTLSCCFPLLFTAEVSSPSALESFYV